MGLLSKAQILAAPLPHIDVDVPEWGGAVRLQAFSGLVRVELLDAIYAREAEGEAWDALDEAERPAHGERPHAFDQTLITLLFAIVDEHGQRLFGVGDYEQFQRLSYDTQVTLWRSFFELTSPAPKEELKKSTGSARRGGSSTGSRSRSAGRSKS